MQQKQVTARVLLIPRRYLFLFISELLTFFIDDGKIYVNNYRILLLKGDDSMTAIQQQAVQLIYQLPDDKIRAIITLAVDELSLIELRKQKELSEKKNAFARLEALNLVFPDNFDADAELSGALEEKYGIAD